MFLKRAHFGGSVFRNYFRTPKKIWKCHSMMPKLSDLVEQHLSYLRIYFGGLAGVWNFRNWIFPKKSSKKWSLHKYPPLFSRCRDFQPQKSYGRLKFEKCLVTHLWTISSNVVRWYCRYEALVPRARGVTAALSWNLLGNFSKVYYNWVRAAWCERFYFLFSILSKCKNEQKIVFFALFAMKD